MVFLWSVCGEMRGKRGLWMAVVGGGKMRHFFQLYFFAARDGAGLRWVGGVGFGWVDGEQTTATAQCGLGCGSGREAGFSAARLTMRL